MPFCSPIVGLASEKSCKISPTGFSNGRKNPSRAPPSIERKTGNKPFRTAQEFHNEIPRLIRNDTNKKIDQLPHGETGKRVRKC